MRWSSGFKGTTRMADLHKKRKLFMFSCVFLVFFFGLDFVFGVFSALSGWCFAWWARIERLLVSMIKQVFFVLFCFGCLLFLFLVG